MTPTTHRFVSEQELSAVLQDFEAQHDLLRYEIDGWCAWPVMRFSVAMALQQRPKEAPSLSPLTRGERLTLLGRDLLALPWLRRSKFLAKTSSSAHREMEVGKRKDVYLDDLLSTLIDVLKIEDPDTRGFGHDPLAYLLPRRLTTSALNILGLKLSQRLPPRNLRVVATAISKALTSSLELSLFHQQTVADALLTFSALRRAWKCLFARVQPKIVFVIDSGEQSVFAAARESGAKVVELQHGFTHRHFPGNSWSSYAIPYKPRMPLPDRIFLYGEHWKNELSALGFWTDELRAVGSPRVDAHRGSQTPADNGAAFTLVVTTQGVDSERLVIFFRDFLELVPKNRRIRLYFKMHPSYQSNSKLFNDAFHGRPDVHIVPSASEPTTFDLLKKADLHLSIYSTCHYEALALGTPTAILPLSGWETVGALIDAGHATLLKDAQHLCDLISHPEALMRNVSIGDEYFLPGALRNMRREIDSLLNENE